MSDCASRMANHHVATVPESLERAPIEVRAPIGERSVSPEHAACAMSGAGGAARRNTDLAAQGIKSVKLNGCLLDEPGCAKDVHAHADGEMGGKGEL